MNVTKLFAAGILVVTASAVAAGRLRAEDSPAPAPAPGEKVSEKPTEKAAEKHSESAAQLPPSDPHHAERCAGCSAEAVWICFLDHLRDLHQEDLIPENLLPRESKEERG